MVGVGLVAVYLGALRLVVARDAVLFTGARLLFLYALLLLGIAAGIGDLDGLSGLYGLGERGDCEQDAENQAGAGLAMLHGQSLGGLRSNRRLESNGLPWAE
jgi:hypothetical protein